MFNIYERDYGVTLEADRDLNTPKIENKTEAKLLRGMTIDKVDLLKKIDEQKRTIEQQEETIAAQGEEIQAQNETINGLTEQIENLPTLIQEYLEQYVNAIAFKSVKENYQISTPVASDTRTLSTGIKRKNLMSVDIISGSPVVNAIIDSIDNNGNVSITLTNTSTSATGLCQAELLVLYKETT